VKARPWSTTWLVVVWLLIAPRLSLSGLDQQLVAAKTVETAAEGMLGHIAQRPFPHRDAGGGDSSAWLFSIVPMRAEKLLGSSGFTSSTPAPSASAYTSGILPCASSAAPAGPRTAGPCAPRCPPGSAARKGEPIAKQAGAFVGRKIVPFRASHSASGMMEMEMQARVDPS
jgi:hypothetical protein